MEAQIFKGRTQSELASIEDRMDRIEAQFLMEQEQEFSIPPDTKFSDIIVPTMDTIRSSYLLEMLLTNKKTVSYCAYAFRYLPNEYLK